MFGYCSPWINDRPWTMQPLWEVKCCPDVDTKNKFFALMRAIFGYQVGVCGARACALAWRLCWVSSGACAGQC